MSTRLNARQRTLGAEWSSTDATRRICIPCAEGKQAKNKQARVDSGESSPIQVDGGVICSDLKKGPMQPVNRLGTRYMMNFVDHPSNYCKIFLAKTKTQAAMYFEHFQAEFERRFRCCEPMEVPNIELLTIIARLWAFVAT
jgi:hypothetical protein